MGVWDDVISQPRPDLPNTPPFTVIYFFFFPYICYFCMISEDIIKDPHCMLGVPPAKIHRFQIFVVVACDYLRFTRNKAHHDDTIPNALFISTTINKNALEHYSAWTTKYDKTLEV